MTFRTKGLNKQQQQLQRGQQDSRYPNNNHRQHRNRYDEEDGSGDDKTGAPADTYCHPQRLAVQHKVLSTPSNSSGTLNPEAHEFKYKSLTANLSESDDEPNKKNAECGNKIKGLSYQVHPRDHGS